MPMERAPFGCLTDKDLFKMVFRRKSTAFLAETLQNALVQVVENEVEMECAYSHDQARISKVTSQMGYYARSLFY